MLPKSKRIPRKKFALLFSGAKTFRNGLFLLRMVGNKDQNSRFAFSVSKKVSKSAVVRNKMRREGYRLLQKHLLEIKTSNLVSFTFRQVPKNKEEVAKSLEALLIESRLIK